MATSTSASKNAPQSIIEVVTLSDTTQQIMTNSAILFPREQNLRVVTAQTPSGLLYHSMLVADKPQPKDAQYKIHDTKIIIKSQGAQERRSAMMDLLQETERRVGKELLTAAKGASPPSRPSPTPQRNLQVLQKNGQAK